MWYLDKVNKSLFKFILISILYLDKTIHSKAFKYREDFGEKKWSG